MGSSLKICRVIPFLVLAILAWPAFALELVEEAYSRPLPPGQSTAVVYLSVENSSSKTIKLTSVSSSLGKSAEFHRHIHEDGMMMMRKVEQLEIEPGKILRFQPGGYHIMLFGLKQPLRVGDTFVVQLNNADGEVLDATVEVKAY
ncbi:copper chaperone PCu(A)C [uncultured Pseudoteredinibacter sp.]|uniref:copper chaperone PCu(A)C n=1 Tax=uncultured Pseudoteredinibacter sp. TaxID=1641701 RepID=UPI00262EF8CE|nr:copper chaperone PCu(A)C [uncultured Pseudoteredinibacter sp.]